ncbi:MAG: glycosyltransferase family 4 protein [Blastocatellia bacterium]
MDKQKANVLIVCGAGIVSGKEIMTLELARGLKSKGQSAHVLTSVWSDEAFPSRLEEIGLPFDRLPLGFISLTLTRQCLNWTYGQLVRWPELLRGYRALLKTQKPRTVIHTNWHHLLVLYPLLRADRDLFWVHDVVPDKRHYKIVFQMLGSRLRRFVPVSNAVAESLRRSGIPEDKIHVIYNGLPDPAIGVERISGSRDAVRLGIIGQVNPCKGHDDLLEAFGQLSAQWPNIEIHIFGHEADDYGQQLRSRSASLGLNERVKWHGYVSSRPAIFSNIDICVVPSRVEDSLPTVAIEAASFGLPAIATQRGGLPEIVKDGVTGILVPSNNPTALATGIERLLADPDLRYQMGLKARQRMLEMFSHERFVNEFLLLLNASPAQ